MNNPNLTFGISPKLSAIAERSIQTSLAEFERCYRGNGVRLHVSDFGEIWWLDPEGETVFEHHFAICSVVSGLAKGIEYEIHFAKSQ